MFAFSTEITLGNVISVIGFAVAAWLFIMRIDKKVFGLDLKMTLVTDELRDLKTVVVTQAQQDTRLRQLEKLVDELRHGEGMVLPLHRGAREISS